MNQILRVAIPVPLRRTFDYLMPLEVPGEGVMSGRRVSVPFGPRQKIGVVVDVADASNFAPSKLKRAFAIIDATPVLSPHDLDLLHWASRYYCHPIGEVVAAALSVGQRKCLPEPKLERRLFHVEQPEHTATDLSGPRQIELLKRLTLSPSGQSAAELNTLGWNWRTPAQVLVRLNLAEWRSLPPKPSESAACNTVPIPDLTTEQRLAVEEIGRAFGRYQTFLLDGITGSGKTEVYLRAAELTIALGLQVMVLLPEISLTPQFAERFRARLGSRLALYHSGLSDSDRSQAWQVAQRGETAILLGTRSAVFLPMPRLGLIIVDEEHDISFKQQDGFRFSARDVAVKRASLAGVPLVLGSATPSLESLENYRRGRYVRLVLSKRAGTARQPAFRIIDIRAQNLQAGLSHSLVAAVRETLAQREQALLFLNRRGYAPTLICHNCGWVAQCRRCDANFVVHKQEGYLKCHHCGSEARLASQCPDCAEPDLRSLGLGTERIENALVELFPKARIARIDRDSVRKKGALEYELGQIRDGEVDLLIGTQMLTKGHHFPRVTLVGILDVDAGLYGTEFRSSERTAQLIVQVAGRSGRAERPGSVFLQTRHPEHPLLRLLISDGYHRFAEACAAERQIVGLPPFAYQALWRAESTSAPSAEQFLRGVASFAQKTGMLDLKVLGPAPAPMARRAGHHRFHVLFQTNDRASLHRAVEQTLDWISDRADSRRVRWSVDIDPAELA